MPVIALNANSSPRRRNFSLAHELGHFLSLWHKPVGDAGFQCSRKDMVEGKQHSQHLRQEAEANRFAIELLAPMRLMKPFVMCEPGLSQIISAGERLDISKAAAARRYVELHADRLAVVFSQHGRMTAYVRGEGFPFLRPRIRERLPELDRSWPLGAPTQ
ncbi:ImmA/IrrE family metallo-endopeptidase [Hyphomonadaceae bacterium BL14]|nr:ImmA/IrrE family metallo-endopeptidase [Hyphomonadaceae bacterium BL14]